MGKGKSREEGVKGRVKGKGWENLSQPRCGPFTRGEGRRGKKKGEGKGEGGEASRGEGK